MAELPSPQPQVVYRRQDHERSRRCRARAGAAIGGCLPFCRGDPSASVSAATMLAVPAKPWTRWGMGSFLAVGARGLYAFPTVGHEGLRAVLLDVDTGRCGASKWLEPAMGLSLLQLVAARAGFSTGSWIEFNVAKPTRASEGDGAHSSAATGLMRAARARPTCPPRSTPLQTICSAQPQGDNCDQHEGVDRTAVDRG